MALLVIRSSGRFVTWIALRRFTLRLDGRRFRLWWRSSCLNEDSRNFILSSASQLGNFTSGTFGGSASRTSPSRRRTPWSSAVDNTQWLAGSVCPRRRTTTLDGSGVSAWFSAPGLEDSSASEVRWRSGPNRHRSRTAALPNSFSPPNDCPDKAASERNEEKIKN